MLADVSVTWYTFLEQGRPINMSAEALARVAEALRLGVAETHHLLLLANRPPRGTPVVENVPGPVYEFICSLDRSPAWLVNPRYDILCWSSAASLWLDIDAVPAGDRNLLWLMLTHPQPAAKHVDWEGDTRRLMAALRVRHAENQDDPRFGQLIDRLMGASSFFRDWWPHHEVAYAPTLVIELEHPDEGRLRFSAASFRPEGATGLRMLIWTPDDATRARLGEA